MPVTAHDFLVFETYRDAGGHAFSKGVVTEPDKDSYQAVFGHLRDSVHEAVATADRPHDLHTWNCRFARNGGIQGQRPLDLWASIINADSEAFSKFPQVYAIASEGGVELGFSVSIHEDDYFNQEVKRKTRPVIPVLNRKLPQPGSPVAIEVSDRVSADPTWRFGEKTRQGPNSSFDNFNELLAFLKSSSSSPKGGGAVYKILDFDEAATDGRLAAELSEALTTFRPIMDLLRPTVAEATSVSNLVAVAQYAEELPDLDSADDADGRRKVLRAVAVRQGQAKFREALLGAYESKCAVTGCDSGPVLQAAHIAPYNGLSTNNVKNGILLRADIHTLFDLGLLRIDPDSLVVSVISDLQGTEYEQYHGQRIRCPSKPTQMPSRSSLQKKSEMFPAV